MGVGAVDSPQATLIPMWHLGATDLHAVHHNVGVGKHGYHVRGDRDARALMDGTIDAACMLDGNHLLFSQEGTLAPGTTRILTQTPVFDHCNMTVLSGKVTGSPSVERFGDLLLSMSYNDPPEVRPLLDLEGLKALRPGRVSGYGPLEAAVEGQGFYGDDGSITAKGYEP